MQPTIDHVGSLSIDGQQMRVDLDEFKRPFYKVIVTIL